MTDERDFLHRSDEFSIELVVTDHARFILTTDGSSDWDLTSADDVVVVFEGEGLPLNVESSERAVATLELSRLEAGGTLMIRVHEFLDGWEF